MAGSFGVGYRFAGQNPEYLALLREPTLWTAGLGALGVLDALNSDQGGGQELGVNAMLTALPMLGAAGGAAALAMRSPRVAKYVDERLGTVGGRSLLSKKQAEEAERSFELQKRVQKMLQPHLRDEEIIQAIDAETRERLRSVLSYGSMAGAALGAAGALAHEGGSPGIMQ